MLIIVTPAPTPTGMCVGDRDILVCYDTYLTYSMSAFMLPSWFKVSST
jgi:hypothetical protein